jgi:DNA-binding Xre family transcriptional regulator
VKASRSPPLSRSVIQTEIAFNIDMNILNYIRFGDWWGFKANNSIGDIKTRKPSAKALDTNGDDTQEDHRRANNKNDEEAARQFVNSSDVDLDDDGKLDLDDDEQSPYKVFEPTVALRPRCYSMQHAGWKGKARDTGISGRPANARACGFYSHCKAARFHPSSAAPQPIRLCTGNFEHDLKRWVCSLNEKLSGGYDDRSTFTGLLAEEDIAKSDVLSALRFAIDGIRSEHESIQHLVEYCRRAPYFLNFTSVFKEADMRYLKLNVDVHMKRLSYEELLEELVMAGNELDYLRGNSEGVASRVLERMKTLAKLNYGWEVKTLLENGFVDDEWIDDNCW